MATAAVASQATYKLRESRRYLQVSSGKLNIWDKPHKMQLSVNCAPRFQPRASLMMLDL